jgi:hypothetical protein
MVNNPNGVGGWQPGHAPQQVEAFALTAHSRGTLSGRLSFMPPASELLRSFPAGNRWRISITSSSEICRKSR